VPGSLLGSSTRRAERYRVGHTRYKSAQKLALELVPIHVADLAAYANMRADGTADKRKLVGERMRHWQTDADLAGIRDEAALGKLPAAEREEWRRLWADVARLINKSK